MTTAVMTMAAPSQKPQQTYVRRDRLACCRASHESLHTHFGQQQVAQVHGRIARPGKHTIS